MQLDVYAQEIIEEIQIVTKEGRTKEGEPCTFKGIRLYLHSMHRLHDMPNGDDRSSITIWLPRSVTRRIAIANMFRKIGELIENEIDPEEI